MSSSLRGLSRHFATGSSAIGFQSQVKNSRAALRFTAHRDLVAQRGLAFRATQGESKSSSWQQLARPLVVRSMAMAAGATPSGGGGSSPPKLIIFGGSGFVGSRVSEEAQRTGLTVVSISRSGVAPKGLTGAWVDRVQWTKGDIFEPATWAGQLEGAVGVISTLGGFGSNEFMYRICGEANMQLMEAAAAAKVPRFAFISVHDYGLPGFVIPGYFNGKRDAEKKLATLFPTGGIALRPGFVYGTRQVGSFGIPLQAVGVPLEKLTNLLPASLASIPLIGAAFVPPVSAEAVAKAAVRAVTDPSVPAGIMTLDTIIRGGRK